MSEPAVPVMRPPESLQSRNDALHEALDVNATRRAELCDQRRREHHRWRQIHHDRGDGHCAEDGQELPCRSVKAIETGETVVKA
jgi:hypothetical protein